MPSPPASVRSPPHPRTPPPTPLPTRPRSGSPEGPRPGGSLALLRNVRPRTLCASLSSRVADDKAPIRELRSAEDKTVSSRIFSTRIRFHQLLVFTKITEWNLEEAEPIIPTAHRGRARGLGRGTLPAPVPGSAVRSHCLCRMRAPCRAHTSSWCLHLGMVDICCVPFISFVQKPPYVQN